MSEKRFICGLGFPINSDDPIRIISDSVEDKDYYKFSDICNVLNEQQATINRMKHSLNTIYKSFEKKFGYDMRNAIWLIDEISYEEWEDKLHIAETDAMNHKESSMYWKNKCDEQQATIRKLQDLCGESDGENAKLRIENKRLQEEKEYWESKAMTLLLQVRRLTSRMTDKEVKEFSKELEDE